MRSPSEHSWLVLPAATLAIASVVVAVVASVLAPSDWDTGLVVLFVALVGVASVAGRLGWWLSPDVQFFLPTAPFVVATAVLIGPSAAAAVGAVGASAAHLSRSWPKPVIVASVGALAGVVAGLVAAASAGAPLVVVCGLASLAVATVHVAGGLLICWARRVSISLSSLAMAEEFDIAVGALLAPVIVVAYLDFGLVAGLVVVVGSVVVGEWFLQTVQSSAFRQQLHRETQHGGSPGPVTEAVLPDVDDEWDTCSNYGRY